MMMRTTRSNDEVWEEYCDDEVSEDEDEED
jgi:hypothetical protein